MSLVRLFALALLAGVAVPLWADPEIAYVPITLCPSQPYDTVRDYWDNTGQFCFETRHRRQTWAIGDMGEVILRHDGQWLVGPYVDALSESNRATVAAYDHYAIRYLALGLRDALGTQPFVAQVFYGWHGAKLTTYAFGEITALGAVRLTGYSDADATGAAPRAVLKTIKNVFKMFEGRNPNRAAVEELKNEERRRVRPTVDVVRRFGASGRVSPKP